VKTLILSFIAILSTNALALDLAVKHESLCSSPAVKSEMGALGSCRIVVDLAPSEATTGSCTGKVFSAVPCSIAYSATEEGTNLRIKCGSSAEAPMKIEAESLGYTVSAVVTKEDQTETIITDPAQYSYFESSLLSLALTKTELLTDAAITLNLKSGPTNLTEIVCK
jgi:hypothetical protein